MSQVNRAPMECENCKQTTHHTTQNPRIKLRLALKKFCSTCGHHTAHKKTK